MAARRRRFRGRPATRRRRIRPRSTPKATPPINPTSRTERGRNPPAAPRKRGVMASHAQFAGRVIVITGASSGFGKGAALAFAAGGASLGLAARRGAVLDELVTE